MSFPAGNLSMWAAIGDFNGDCKQDLAVANAGDNKVSILLGDGSGGFEPPTFFDEAPAGSSSFFVHVAIGDLNGDGSPDLVLANQSTVTLPFTISVLLNTTPLSGISPVGPNNLSNTPGSTSGSPGEHLAVSGCHVYAVW